MKIRIHRGAHQIGGCVTEIESDSGTRILIDLGHNLPGESDKADEYDTPASLSALLEGVSAVIYTHNHGDHLGFYDKVPEGITQYIGEMAREVICNVLDETLNRATIAKHRTLIEDVNRKVSALKSFRTYNSTETFIVNDIFITPFFVSHSAADAYMLLIECDGKRVLHTGDVREHGFLGKGLEPTLRKYIRSVYVLITEGTMLSRDDGQTKTESEIQSMMSGLMDKYKYVFVLCSSTNFDRLAGIHKVNAKHKGRSFVCDVYQNKQFKTLTRYSGKHSDLYVIDNAVEMSLRKVNLHDRMVKNGFTMIVRDSTTFRKWIAYLMLRLDPSQVVLVYSQYKGYLEDQPKLQEFVKLFGNNMAYVHTSGHATRKTLAKICSIVNPSTAIIPIHKDADANFLSLNISDELKGKVVGESVIRNGIDIEIS